MEIHPRIRWELLAEPLGSGEHTLETTVLSDILWQTLCRFINVRRVCCCTQTPRQDRPLDSTYLACDVRGVYKDKWAIRAEHQRSRVDFSMKISCELALLQTMWTQEIWYFAQRVAVQQALKRALYETRVPHLAAQRGTARTLQYISYI
jgi:hypothetical protein